MNDLMRVRQMNDLSVGKQVQISVLMPVHNAEKTVLASVRSTLNALGAKDELLVALHNCSDGSSKQLGKIFDARLKIITVSGGGLALALNELLRFASNEYVARMDSDDFCLPWRFKIQKRHLDRADAIFSTAVIWLALKHGKLLVPQYPTRLVSEDVNLLLTSLNPLVHPTMLAKREVLVSLGGYRDVPGEDLDLWLRMAVSGLKIIRLGLPVIIYRVGPGQLSGQAWYKDGWRSNLGIANLRQKLKSSLPKLSALKFRLLLEIIGFPRPANFKRVKEFIAKSRSTNFL